MSPVPTYGERMDEQRAAGNQPNETIGATGNAPGTTQKDPSDWVSGAEPMTGAQKSYLDTLARDAGEELPADLTKAQASEHIDRLRGKAGLDDAPRS